MGPLCTLLTTNNKECIKPLQFKKGSAKPASYQEGTQPMASLSCHVQIGLCIFLDGNGSRRQAARSKATAAKSLYISRAMSLVSMGEQSRAGV